MQEGLQTTSNTSTKDGCVFALRRAAPQFPARSMIEVDFSCVDGSMRTIPLLNKDKTYYTPAFMLESEMVKVPQNQEHYYFQHNRKLIQTSEEKEQMFVPQPSRANRFCCICRHSYDDYLTHVNVPTHQQLLRESPYYLMIQELCAHSSKKVIIEDQAKKQLKRRNQRKGKPKNKKMFQEHSGSGSSTLITSCVPDN